MMNAEVTAENRPAYKPSQHIVDTRDIHTHEDQCGVQVFVVPLSELPVVLLSFVAVYLIELGSVIVLGLWRVLFLTARDISIKGNPNA